MFANLVENAVKYTPQGGRVEVSGESNEDEVVVRVSDTGIGIPPENLARIFERFYRVDKARSKETGGTGLGLSIVRHIAQNHGGHVAVESERARARPLPSTYRVASCAPTAR
jgi:signal transduction histidine kinase